MKKLFVIMTALLFVVSFSAVSIAAISGSPHDFSSATWNTSNEICVTCHTPHNADTSVTDSPLWNHTVTSASFTVYSSGTLDAGPLGQPSGVSKLCLSCHDGTVSLDAFGGAAGTGVYVSNPGTHGDPFLDINLSNDHPVSFIYNASLAGTDGELQDPETYSSGLGGTIEADMLFGATAGSKTLECASCHDAHDSANLGADGYLLRKANTGSALCLTCHIK